MHRRIIVEQKFRLALAFLWPVQVWEPFRTGDEPIDAEPCVQAAPFAADTPYCYLSAGPSPVHQATRHYLIWARLGPPLPQPLPAAQFTPAGRVSLNHHQPPVFPLPARPNNSPTPHHPRRWHCDGRAFGPAIIGVLRP
eukprot:EG_transcript_26067